MGMGVGLVTVKKVRHHSQAGKKPLAVLLSVYQCGHFCQWTELQAQLTRQYKPCTSAGVATPTPSEESINQTLFLYAWFPSHEL